MKQKLNLLSLSPFIITTFQITPTWSQDEIINKVAIFPVKFYEDADNMKSILIKELTYVSDQFNCLKLTHSYYSLDKRYIVKNLRDKSVINSEKLRNNNLWDGKYPDRETISRIGRELGIDTVITGSLRVSNPWSDKYNLGYIHIFMVDVGSGTILKESNPESTNDARDYVNGIVHRIMGSYAKEYCQ